VQGVRQLVVAVDVLLCESEGGGKEVGLAYERRLDVEK
jgi:hypothetical protein